MHIIAAKAVCFKEAGEAQRSRTTSGRSSPTPPGWRRCSPPPGFRLVSGGTDNHLMLVDVFSKGITGKVAEAALGKAGITVNKNAIPFDQNPPMVASGIRVGTPAVTTRGMREAEMDVIGELIARALKTPDDDAALGMVRDGSRTAVPEVPAVPGTAGLSDGDPERVALRERRTATADLAEAVAEAFAPAGALAGAHAGLRAARGPGRDGGRRRARLRRGRRPPRRSRHGHRQDARLSRSRHPEPPARARSPPARRTCRNRSSSRTSRRCATRSDVPFTAAYMKGRANYLCLHRLDQLNDAGRSVGPRRLPADHPGVGRADRDRRPRRARGPARGSAVLERGLGDRRNLSRHRVPALRRVLRDPDAPARRRVRRRDRQPSPAVRRRRGPAERVRRSDSGVQPRSSSTRRTSSRTWRRSISACRSATTGSRISRATSSAWPRRRRSPIARPATRSHRQSTRSAIAPARSSRELAFAHRSRRPAEERGAGPRRPTARSPARATRARRSPARWTSSRRRSRCSERRRAADGRRRRRCVEAAAGTRAPCRRDSRRTSGSCSAAADPEYVYFVEFRGKGVFLRAAPIDVSRIVRERCSTACGRRCSPRPR